MPPATNKERSTTKSTRNSPNSGTAIRPNTRRNGNTLIIEELQDIKDPIEGRKFLEKHLLLCPPGESAMHTSLATCLHQVTAMAGIPKPATNAICAVAFLLKELEDMQIIMTIREALDSQMTEFSSDIKLLIEDTKEKISNHILTTENLLPKSTTQSPSQQRQSTTTYASTLISPPQDANLKLAAKEGIKAQQFLLEGIKETKISHFNTLQLKTELNKIFSELELHSGKI